MFCGLGLSADCWTVNKASAPSQPLWSHPLTFILSSGRCVDSGFLLRWPRFTVGAQSTDCTSFKALGQPEGSRTIRTQCQRSKLQQSEGTNQHPYERLKGQFADLTQTNRGRSGRCTLGRSATRLLRTAGKGWRATFPAASPSASGTSPPCEQPPWALGRSSCRSLGWIDWRSQKPRKSSA